ncbi:MAG: hypothetical protein J2P17_17700 [Mycobacterium sp.]|nr:hypothetical protein [Mycobacterium sp.]
MSSTEQPVFAQCDVESIPIQNPPALPVNQGATADGRGKDFLGRHHPALGISCRQPDTPAFAMSMSDDGHLIECDPATDPATRCGPAGMDNRIVAVGDPA